MDNDQPFGFGFSGFDPHSPLKLEGTDAPPCTGTKDGSHCFEPTGTALLSNPPQHVEACRHCPVTRRLMHTHRVYIYE